jgi:RND family efflux transporter MFP subunit
MKRIWRVFWVLMVVVGVLGGGAALIKRKKMALRKAPKYGLRPILVKVAEAKKGNLAVKIHYLGVVETVQVTNISARVTARIEKVLCDEGDHVKKGQTLIVLDEREKRKEIASIASQIEETGADLASNEATVSALKDSTTYWQGLEVRDRSLAEKGNISVSHADATADKANEMQGRFNAAKRKSTALRHKVRSLGAKKAEMEIQLSYYTITSPYEGLVRERQVDPGDLATPGKRLLVVENRDQFKLAFDIPQKDLPGVKEGDQVLFEVNNEVRKGVLAHTYPSLNKAAMLRAEVNLSTEQAKGLSNGQYVPLSVIIHEIGGATLLPRACLIEGQHQKTYVFLVRGERLSPRSVKILGTGGDYVAVDGVEPGERAVTNTFLGWARLSAGNKVEVQE